MNGEQQEIVRRVAGLFALADQLELQLAKARGPVDRLTPSLLARSFGRRPSLREMDCRAPTTPLQREREKKPHR